MHGVRMVFAWLCTVRSCYTVSTGARPFRKQGRTLKQLDNFEDGEMVQHHIYALINCQPDFEYDYHAILNASQTEQYRFWLRHVGNARLWFFNVSAVVPFQTAIHFNVCHSLKHQRQIQTLGVVDAIDADALADYLPDDFDRNIAGAARLCISLPRKFVKAIICEGSQSLCIPSPWSPTVFKAPAWMLRVSGQPFVDAFKQLLSRYEGSQPGSVARFDITMREQLVGDLRSLLQPNILEHRAHDCRNMIGSWVGRLQTDLDYDVQIRETLYARRYELLLQYLLLSTHLVDGSHLKQLLSKACDAMMPTPEANACKHNLNLKLHLNRDVVPGKAQLSRARLTFDVGQMMKSRCENWLRLQHQVPYCHWLIWGSHRLNFAEITKL